MLTVFIAMMAVGVALILVAAGTMATGDYSEARDRVVLPCFVVGSLFVACAIVLAMVAVVG
jgi:hypothetical protein